MVAVVVAAIWVVHECTYPRLAKVYLPYLFCVTRKYTYPRLFSKGGGGGKVYLPYLFCVTRKYTYPRLFQKDRVSILVIHPNRRAGAPDFRRACVSTRTRRARRRDVVVAAGARKMGGAKSILTLDQKVYLP